MTRTPHPLPQQGGSFRREAGGKLTRLQAADRAPARATPAARKPGGRKAADNSAQPGMKER